MQFQQDRPKDKKLQLFLPENLEKPCLTELYGAPLEGSTIFLYRSSTRRTSLDSSRLAELKYPFFAGEDLTLKFYGLEPFSLTIFTRGIDISFSIQLHKPYKVGKLSIR